MINIRPPIAAVVGHPKLVTDGVGSAARVTLNGIPYVARSGAARTTEWAVLDLTFHGVGPRPFDYGEAEVYVAHPEYWPAADLAHDDRLWDQDDDQGSYQPSPPDRVTFLGRALRAGELTAGQTVRGVVVVALPKKTRWLLFITGTAAHKLAEWRFTSR